MNTLVIIIHILVSIFLIVTVLFQVGKGATIGSSFGGSSQAIFGGAGPATLLTKVTIACAVIFMFTSFYLTYVGTGIESASIMKGVDTVKEVPKPSAEATPPTVPPLPQK